MLMMEHLNDIDHIIHHLEQIERTSYDDKTEVEPLEHSRMIAREVHEEFMGLIHALETEEYEHSKNNYSPEMMHKMCLVSYFISRYDHDMLFSMNLSLEETIQRAADLIGCNPESILRMRSMYGDHRINMEMGWNQNIRLTEDMARIQNECEILSEYEVALECKVWFRK